MRCAPKSWRSKPQPPFRPPEDKPWCRWLIRFTSKCNGVCRAPAIYPPDGFRPRRALLLRNPWIPRPLSCPPTISIAVLARRVGALPPGWLLFSHYWSHPSLRYRGTGKTTALPRADQWRLHRDWWRVPSQAPPPHPLKDDAEAQRLDFRSARNSRRRAVGTLTLSQLPPLS